MRRLRNVFCAKKNHVLYQILRIWQLIDHHSVNDSLQLFYYLFNGMKFILLLTLVCNQVVPLDGSI